MKGYKVPEPPQDWRAGLQANQVRDFGTVLDNSTYPSLTSSGRSEASYYSAESLRR